MRTYGTPQRRRMQRNAASGLFTKSSIFDRFRNMFTAEIKPEASSGEIATDMSQMTEGRFRLGNDIAESIESRTASSTGFIGLGMSIGVHAAGVLSFLLLATFHASRSTFEAPVVFVHLTQVSESGWEAGGVPHPDAAGGGASPSSAAPKAPDTQTAAPTPSAAVHKTAHVPKAHPHAAAIVKRLRTAVSPKPRRAEKIHAKAEDASPSVSSIHPVKSPVAAPDTAATNSQPPSSTGGAGSVSGSSPDGNTGHGHGAGAGNGASKGSGGGAGGGSGSGTGGGMGGEFGLKQVDQAPVPIRKVTPEFPEAARKLGASGKVLLKFLVKTDGSVTKASVVEASPAGLFDQSALNAVINWRFTPGVYHGHAVATWVMLPVYFRLSR